MTNAEFGIQDPKIQEARAKIVEEARQAAEAGDPSTPEFWEENANRWTLMALTGTSESVAARHIRHSWNKADVLREGQTSDTSAS